MGLGRVRTPHQRSDMRGYSREGRTPDIASLIRASRVNSTPTEMLSHTSEGDSAKIFAAAARPIGV